MLSSALIFSGRYIFSGQKIVFSFIQISMKMILVYVIQLLTGDAMRGGGVLSSALADLASTSRWSSSTLR